MPSSPEPAAGGVWACLGPAPLLARLAPLAAAHRRLGAHVIQCEGTLADAGCRERMARQLGGRAATLLVLEDPALPSARLAYHSPFLEPSDVLLGWLRLGERELTEYAERACVLLQRQASAEPITLLLAPRERRYLELMGELEQAAQPALPCFRWTAERIRRAPLLAALRVGSAALVYCGHGTREGWLAYGGLGAGDLAGDAAWSGHETHALVFSLSCRTGASAGPRSTEREPRVASFAETLVARGVAGAVLAPASDVLHLHHRHLALTLVRALARGERRLSGIVRALAASEAPLAGYSVIGDPALSAAAAPGAAERARRVFAPAADTPLRTEPVLAAGVGVDRQDPITCAGLASEIARPSSARLRC